MGLYLNTFITTIFGFAAHEGLRIFYPQTYFDIMFTLTCNSIYIFSLFQKWATNVYNKFISSEIVGLVKREFFNTSNQRSIELVKDGNIIYKLKKMDYLSTAVEYDFIVDDEFVCKPIYNEWPNEFFQPVSSSAKFLFSELLVGGETLTLHFSNSNYDYSASNNRIDKQFLQYFLRKHYLDKYREHYHLIYNLSDYQLRIIDNAVNIFLLSDKDSIRFTENSYIIEKGDCETTSQEEPELTEPELTEPELTEPELTEPEPAEPEPEPAESGPAESGPELTEPELTEPEPEQKDDEEIQQTEFVFEDDSKTSHDPNPKDEAIFSDSDPVVKTFPTFSEPEVKSDSATVTKEEFIFSEPEVNPEPQEEEINDG